jgi:YXWGXW repeat-containing protein
MKPLNFLSLSLGLGLLAPLAALAQPVQAMPQLILNGDQWVIQVPANSAIPRSIVLQLATPNNQPPPTVVLQQPPVAQIGVTAPSEEVYVESAPPPPPREIIPVAPDRFHIWIGGHYEYRHHNYVWISGHYERPPHRDAHWEPGRWEHRGGRYFYVEGHWGH